ncbi:MAG: hypothetical protein IJJ33_18720, partial [Victivallales bacterium]|nr:hypothetical protein [Victivallales bacterium]
HNRRRDAAACSTSSRKMIDFASVFKRDDLRGIYPQQLDRPTSEALGGALAKLVQARGIPQPTIVLGHDCRKGGQELVAGFTAGAQEAGARVIPLGLVSTEHVYFACGGERPVGKVDAGVMVTASHNPKEYNGMKILWAGCLPFTGGDLAELRRRAEEQSGHPVPSLAYEPPAEAVREAFLRRYARHLLTLAGMDRLPQQEKPVFTAVLLAGHGMGGVAFAPLAEILQSRGFAFRMFETEADGSFPNGVPNPLLPDFMERLGTLTRQCQAQLGFGFDGDADRAAFVDAQGRQIIPSQVLALIARSKVAGLTNHPVVMRNLCCSRLLADLFPAGGDVTLVDTPVGHGRIKLLMRSPQYQSRTVFAGEHSGHYFYPEFDYVDSGVLTVLLMLKLGLQMQQAVRQLTDDLDSWRTRYAWSGERNYTLASQEQVLPVIAEVARQMEKCRRQGIVEGVDGLHHVADLTGPYDPAKLAAPDLKLISDDGHDGFWLVLRPSGNEPKLRLNVEAWGEDAQTACANQTATLDALLRRLGAQ